MHDDRRILRLAAGLCALGFIAAIVAPIETPSPIGLGHILTVPLVGLILGEVALLACWSIFSTSTVGLRVLASALALAALEALFYVPLSGELFPMPSVAMLAMTLALLVLKLLGVRLCTPDDLPSPVTADSWRPQFSIRGLMALTVAVALLSAGVRSFERSSGPPRLGLTVIWALCFVAVGILTFLAMLGQARPGRRMAAIFTLSPAFGFAFAYAAQAHRDGRIYIILTMLLYPAVLSASLAVVRTTGFRIARGSEMVASGPAD